MPEDTKLDYSNEIDITKRYDVYCRELFSKVTVFRNVLIKGKRPLLKTQQHDAWSVFIEIEQANGQVAFISYAFVLRLCEAGGDFRAEYIE